MNHPVPDPCACGSGVPYAACCEALHRGRPAANAEELMRSRYSAYVLGLEQYLLDTWHATTRPAQLDLAAQPRPKWLGLEIRRHDISATDRATVEFVARCRVAGRGRRLHEVSRFVREDGRWFYVDGALPDSG